MNADRRKYFRIIATVQADGRNVAALMIERGLGRPYQGGAASRLLRIPGGNDDLDQFLLRPVEFHTDAV